MPALRQKPEVRPLGVRLNMPVQNFGKGDCLAGRRVHGLEHVKRCPDIKAWFSRGLRSENGSEQFAWRFGFTENRFRQVHAESPLQPKQQFDPPEAVKAQVTVQLTVQSQRHLA